MGVDVSKQATKARGGYRPGSGRKLKAQSGWTQIRVRVETRDALREQAAEAGFSSMGEYVDALAAHARAERVFIQ